MTAYRRWMPFYPEEEKTNPQGNNDLSPRAKFYQRAMYEDAVYPSTVAKPLDSWYDKNLFGRVDSAQNTIIPQLGELVEMQTAAVPGIYCLGFVERAFAAFARHMQTAFITNCLDKRGNTSIINLKARFAYIDPTTKWEAHRDALIQAFINNYVGSLTAPIKNFADFKPAFLEYLRVMSQQVPITKTTFLVSNMVSPLGSGLKIAIAQENAGDDSVKYDDFIADPNFSFYANAAKKYGFLIDKNAPWILTADLFSTAAMKYIDFYLTENGDPITPHNFFPTFFTQTYATDFDDLEAFARRAYTKLLANDPLYEQEKTIYRPGCAEPHETLVYRRTDLGATEGLDTKELIDLYIQLRYNQTQQSGPPMEKVRKRAYEIYRSTPDITTARTDILQYINASYKDFLYPWNYKLINLTLDTRSQTRIIDTVADIAQAIYAPQTATY